MRIKEPRSQGNMDAKKTGFFQTIDVKEKDHPPSKERGLSAKYFTKRVEGEKGKREGLM